MVSQRVGFVSGRDKAGAFRVVSVYRDGSLIKLCGPSGSVLVADLAAVPGAVANEYHLSDVTFSPTSRAA